MTDGILHGVPIRDLRWTVWALINFGAFCLGLFLPIVELRELYIFVDHVVLWRVPVILWQHGEWVLALAVALLGIAYPVAKSLAFAFAWVWPKGVAAFGRMSAISFFDVFMVALLIFVAKGSIAADADGATGLYFLVFFAVSSKLLEWVFGRASISKSEAEPGGGEKSMSQREETS